MLPPEPPSAGLAVAEGVKPAETRSRYLFCISTSGVGWLIHATVRSVGGCGGRLNGPGLTAWSHAERGLDLK